MVIASKTNTAFQISAAAGALRLLRVRFFPHCHGGQASVQTLMVDNSACNSRAAKTSAPSFQSPLLAASWRGFARSDSLILRAVLCRFLMQSKKWPIVERVLADRLLRGWLRKCGY
jgi:hypothetical protein